MVKAPFAEFPELTEVATKEIELWSDRRTGAFQIAKASPVEVIEHAVKSIELCADRISGD